MLNEAEPNQKVGGGLPFFLTFNLNDDDCTRLHKHKEIIEAEMQPM